MLERYNKCVDFCHKTGAQLYQWGDTCYFIVYQTAVDAVKYGREVMNIGGYIKEEDVLFDVHAVAVAALKNFEGVKHINV